MRAGNADCALTFIPFMEMCLLPPGSDGVVPPPPPPGTNDAMTGFLALYDTCEDMNTAAPAEVESLIHDVNEMVDNEYCVIDTSAIVSADITCDRSSPLLSQSSLMFLGLRTDLHSCCRRWDNSRPIGQHQDVVCIDDDIFVQQVFANDGITCADAAATGLCSTLEASGIADRCCISCGDEHRRAEELFPAEFQAWGGVRACPIDQLMSRAQHTSQTCCQDSGCAGGIPRSCSFNCASIILAWKL